MDTVLNQAAKDILDANRVGMVASVTVVTGDATRKATAAQLMAITSYKAFAANKSVIPAAAIAAYLNIDDKGLSKLKQYVSRAKKLYDNQGASYNDADNAPQTIDHEAIMGDTPPSLTTVYKHFNAHKKAMTEQAEKASQAKALQVKAAQAFMDSDNETPEGVANAEELLAKGRASETLGVTNDFTAALITGQAILDAELLASVTEQRLETLLMQAQAIIDELNGLNTQAADDVVTAIVTYVATPMAADLAAAA